MAFFFVDVMLLMSCCFRDIWCAVSGASWMCVLMLHLQSGMFFVFLCAFQIDPMCIVCVWLHLMEVWFFLIVL